MKVQKKFYQFRIFSLYRVFLDDVSGNFQCIMVQLQFRNVIMFSLNLFFFGSNSLTNTAMGFSNRNVWIFSLFLVFVLGHCTGILLQSRNVLMYFHCTIIFVVGMCRFGGRQSEPRFGTQQDRRDTGPSPVCKYNYIQVYMYMQYIYRNYTMMQREIPSQNQ